MEVAEAFQKEADKRKADLDMVQAWVAKVGEGTRLEKYAAYANMPPEIKRAQENTWRYANIDKYKVYEVSDDGALRVVYAAQDRDIAKGLADTHRDLTDAAVVVKQDPGEKKPYYKLAATEDREKFQVMPPLSPEEYSALKDEIRRDGVRHPILVDRQGHILDGHNRLQIWRELVAEGVDMDPLPREVVTGLKSDKDKRERAIKLNMARRHLNREQKRAIVENILKTTPKYSNRQIAELTGVSDKTVGAYRAELEATAEIPQLEKTVGADGKERTRKPKPAPAPTLQKDDSPAGFLERMSKEKPLARATERMSKEKPLAGMAERMAKEKPLAGEIPEAQLAGATPAKAPEGKLPTATSEEAHQPSHLDHFPETLAAIKQITTAIDNANKTGAFGYIFVDYFLAHGGDPQDAYLLADWFTDLANGVGQRTGEPRLEDED